MKILRKDVDLEEFWNRVSESEKSVLFLDYDGTIAPFRIKRDEAVPYPWVPGILNGILETGKTRLVIISGRDVSSIQKLLRLSQQVEIWGCHGRQHLLLNGELKSDRISRAARRALSDAQEWVEDHGLSENMEEKSGCLALHFRGMKSSQADRLERKAATAFEAMLPGTGMEIDRFDGGIELRSAEAHKGMAVEKVLSEYRTIPPAAYLGDDLTDEDAFSAIRGRGLGVLVRDEFRTTMADIWIRPPDELKAFLERWQKETGGP